MNMTLRSFAQIHTSLTADEKHQLAKLVNSTYSTLAYVKSTGVIGKRLAADILDALKSMEKIPADTVVAELFPKFGDSLQELSRQAS